MSALLQEGSLASKRGEALSRLNRYVEDLQRRRQPIESMEAFEREVRQLMAEVEQEVVGEGLSWFDIDAPVVEVDGRRYRQVYRGPKRYPSAAGEVQVERSRYRAKSGEQAMWPLELRAGMMDGYWTALAARQGVWVTAQLPPGEGETLFGCRSQTDRSLPPRPRKTAARCPEFGFRCGRFRSAFSNPNRSGRFAPDHAKSEWPAPLDCASASGSVSGAGSPRFCRPPQRHRSPRGGCVLWPRRRSCAGGCRGNNPAPHRCACAADVWRAGVVRHE